MARASKPIAACKGHRTKKEIEMRQKEEDARKTGSPLSEFAKTKANKIAHKEFLRVRKLMKKIDKDDDLFSGSINRYCLITAEIADFEEKQETIQKEFATLTKNFEEEKICPEDYYNYFETLQRSIINFDAKIMTKRKMLLDIEKENSMTVASNLRNIPKTPEKKENPLLAALLDDE